MADKKHYVVWKGKKPGIYDSWKECKAAIDGFKGTQYMSFPDVHSAKIAFNKSYSDYKGRSKQKKTVSAQYLKSVGQPNMFSISVDAASSGNPGVMEYRGVETKSGKVIFKQGPFEEATNNIGEFLAIVHGLALLKSINSPKVLYTDSRTAMSWVRKKNCNTKLKQNQKNKEIFALITRAVNWLKTNTYHTEIIKWETKAWGEIPADFGRK
ncbi:ribonuclease H family protein [Eudoraea chungangensis]|uniref:ribonuclease H family protein n=1 Tax=Eudoraea chungangensis TaxID=1481905 RepID=UPI0023ED7348|nr:ribonuclease H family protein [Eudoraea chungangensis]